MAQVSRHVHETDVRVADQLHLGRFEQAVVVLAHEAGVFDGFLRQLPHVCLRADDADVGRVVGSAGALVGQGDMLADEHADADARHVEAVEKGLDGVVNVHSLPLALIFEYTLSYFHGGKLVRANMLDAGRVPDRVFYLPTVVTTLS